MKIKTILFIFMLLFLIGNVSALTIVYNFSATYQGINMWAYQTPSSDYGSGIQNSPPSNGPFPTTLGSWADFTTNSALDLDDGSSVNTIDSSSGNTGHASHLYIANMSMSKNDITNMTWLVNRGGQGSTCYFYIWNQSSSSWLACGGSGANNYNAICSITSNISNFFNNSDFVHYLQEVASGSSNSQSASTDFVQLSINYNGGVVNSPSNSQEILNSLSTTLNTSQTGYNNTLWYTWNSGIKNYTLCTNSNECSGTITFPRQGYYNLTVYGNKSENTITSKTVNDLFVGNYTYRENSTANSSAGAWNSPTNVNDGDWNTYGYVAVSPPAYYWANYTLVESDINIKKVIWETKSQSPAILKNFTLPSQCINSKNISFRMNSDVANKFYCWNYTANSFLQLYSGTSYYIYEEAIHWTFYSPNTAPSITNLLANNSNFTTSTVNFTINISDDNDYIKNASIYTARFYGAGLSKTYLPNSLNSRGYNGTSSVKPPSTINLNNENNLLIGDLNTISILDNINITTNCVDCQSSGIRINFKITENASDINNITITAVGNGYEDASEETIRSNFSLYVWNSTSWEHIKSVNDSVINSQDHPLLNINATLSSVTKYVNGNNVSILLMGEFRDTVWGAKTVLDYAKIDLIYNASSLTLNKSIFNQAINTSINNTFNISIEGFADGTHYWYAEVCDSDNSCNQSDVRNFLIDTTPPVITIISPISKTYIADIIDINVSLNEEGSWCGYSLNGASNITMTKFNSTYFNVSQYDFNNGAHTIVFSCNDTLNNFGSNTVNFAVDTIPPVITLNYPLTLTYVNNNTFYFNYTPYSPIGLGTCQLWGNWTTGVWHLNQSNWTTINNTINQFKPTIADGTYKWNIWCNSSIGTTEDWSPQGNQTFIVDTIYPNLNLTSPLNKTYTNNSINLNYTRNDTYLSTCWYTDDDGYTTNTLTNCNNITYTASQGSTTIILYANDSAGNTNSSNVTFYVDSILPSITINTSFSNNSYLNYNTSIRINLTITDTNRQACWYNDNLGANTTFTCGNNLTLNLSEALHTIYIWANDTLNNQNFNSISFTPDVTNPGINITTPITTTSGSKDITFTHSVSDTNLGSCKYSIVNSSGGFDVVNDVESQNRTLTCSEVDKSVTVSGFGTYNLTIWVNDSAGNLNSSTESFTTVASSGTPSGGGGGGGTNETIIIYINKTFCGDGICQPEGNDAGLKEDFYSCSLDCKGFNIDSIFYALSWNCFDNDNSTECFWSGSQTNMSLFNCGNKICQSSENIWNCQEDCGNFNLETILNNCLDIDNKTPCVWSTRLGKFFIGFILITILFSIFFKFSYDGKKANIYKYVVYKLKRRKRKEGYYKKPY